MLDPADAVRELRLPPSLDNLFERTGRLTIAGRVAAQGLLTPDAPAVIEIDSSGQIAKSLSWSALNAAVTRVACGYRAMGVGLHSRVAIALATGIEHVVATHAAWRVGAIPAPLDDQLPPAVSEAQLQLINPHLTIAADPAVGFDLPTVASAAATYDPIEWTLPSTWSILPTGGSTGVPKLAAQRGAIWGRLDRATSAQHRDYGLAVNQRQLVVLPMFHGFGFGYAHAFGVALGHCLVLLTKPTAELLLACVERHAIEFLALVPTQMGRVTRQSDFGVRDLSSIQAVVHGGEPCPALVKRAWMAKLGPTRVYEAYGAADVSLSCTVRGDQWLLRPGTVGRPSGTEVRILDDHGAELPAGSVGRIHCQPATIGASHPQYIGDRNPSRGFRPTGDRGWVDEEGFLYVAGRADNALTMGGVTTAPEPIEETVRLCPAVLEVIVVGLPDADLGERIHAVVHARPGTDPEVVLQWCRDRLPMEKCPRSISLVHELPSSPAGKLDRHRAMQLALLEPPDS